MSQGQLTKVSAKTATEICGRYEITKDAGKLLGDSITPRQFVDLLVQAGQHLDVFDFLAHALPKREAIWWACLGVRHAQGTKLPPAESAALKSAVEWVLDPTESRRRLAQEAG